MGETDKTGRILRSSRFQFWKQLKVYSRQLQIRISGQIDLKKSYELQETAEQIQNYTYDLHKIENTIQDAFFSEKEIGGRDWLKQKNSTGKYRTRQKDRRNDGTDLVIRRKGA